MKSRTYKSLLSLFLCFILLFTGEVPAYAQGIAGIRDRQEQARLEKEEETLRQEREAAIFAVQEGITLSSNFPGTEETLTETGETGQDASAENPWETETGFDGRQDGTPLRQPETEALSEELYGELVETGEYYKTYRLPDGTYKTLFTAYSNTYEENGEEKPIDNTLVSGNGAEDGTYTNKANDIDVTFYGEETGEAALSVSAEGMEALLKPLEGDYGKAAVSENAIRYNGVFENTDMQYTVEPDGVKQDIILLAPSDKTGFTYSLKKEGILARLEDNCICLYENTETTISENALNNSTISGNTSTPDTVSGNSVSGNTVNASPLMVISAPGMEDALGAFSSDVALELSETEDSWLITIRADKEWLEAPERAYPVKIDPSTIVLKNQIHNYTIASQTGAMPNQPCSHAGYIDGLGKTRSYIITDFLYESIMFGQKDVEILSASLNIYQLNDAAGFQIGCYRLANHLPYQNQIWDNTITIDRYIAGEDAVKPAGKGWKSFDVRESVNGWMRATEFKSHGLVLISSNESAPGAMFASDSYPDPAFAPTLEIVWQPAGDIAFNYPLDNTTVNLRPMVQTTVSGKMQCYGVFADGIATPGAYVAYTLSDTAKNYAGAMTTGNIKLYPDSSSFKSLFPAGTLGYKDSLSNWQTAAPFTWYETDTVYTINAQSATAEKLGKIVKSEPFLIYKVTRYDTMQKIADYYGVPLNTILFDNKAADMLLVENNTLFIRNPTRNQNTPYQPADLTDSEKAEIDTALLGRALHCEFGFEPINLSTGNFYLAQEDFSYSDSFGTFALQRSYNSMNSGRVGSFGRGFTALFDESISMRQDGALIYNREDGSSLVFLSEGNGNYKTPDGYQIKLRRESTGNQQAEFSNGVQSYTTYKYVVTEENNSERIFDGGGNLIEIRGENGETLTFGRNKNGKLTGITREGVTMGIATTPEGFISSITMPNGGVFRYGYDNKQNLTSVTDPLGNVKRFVYDGKHRMTAWYVENGVRVVYNTYDSEGRVTSQINETGGRITLQYEDGKTVTEDAAGNRTVYEYDSAYQTTAIRYPDGTVLRKEYQNGHMIKETDRAGVETVFTYDGQGNIIKKEAGEIINYYAYDGKNHLTAVTDACGNITRAEYDSKGNLIKVTDGEENITTFVYDGRNRPVKKTDGNGNTISYEYTGNYLSEIRVNGRVTDTFTYNAMGQIQSRTDGEGNTTSYTYDVLLRNTAVKYPEGNTITVSYGKTGLVESVRDARGGVTVYTYDNGNNITSVTDALGNRYEYTYDANENRLSEKDPEGNTTTYTYDAMDRLVKKTDALGGSYVYAYDNHDNIISITDALGNKQRITYDSYYGQVLSHVDEEDIKTEYGYDLNGNLTSITRDGMLVAAYGYDKNGQVISTTFANGLEETSVYDGNGNCILKTDGNGRTLAFAYDDESRLIKETTASGAEYEYIYDKAGNLTTQNYPDGSRDVFTHDKNGNVLTWTDGEGNTTAYAYDAMGNLVTETFPDGTKYHYAYNLSGQLISSADGRGYVTTYGYDRNGNLTGVTDALNQTTLYEWDPLLRNTKVTDVMGRTTSYAYDPMGNLLSETNPSGGVTQYAYDKTGRLLQTTDALSRSTVYEYDAFGRVTKETDALGGSAEYEYDATGNLTAFTDKLGAKTVYEYDLYGNVLKETDSKGNRSSYGYDVENQLISVTDADGNRAKLAYDNMGRVVRVTDPLGAAESYVYDKAGRLTEKTAPDGGVTAYAYDEAGNLLEVRDSLLRTTTYSYDPSGNITGMTDPSGNSISYTYDPLNRITGVVHEDGSEDLLAYDGAGNLAAIKESGVRVTKYAYDELDRLTGVEDALGNKTAYSYDPCGNLLSETAPDGAQTVYAYDELDRLVSRTLPNEGIYTYTYDKVGNITKVTGPTGSETVCEYDPMGNVTAIIRDKEQKTTYEYDNLNRIGRITDALGGKTVYSYDGAGNLKEVIYADGGTYRYRYDACGRITGITDPAGLYRELSYDRSGQLLTEKTGTSEQRTTVYSYDENGNLTGVTNPLGGKTTYSYDERNRLTETVSPKGAVTSYEYDSLSNLTAVVNAEGTRNIYTYDIKGRMTGENIAGEERYAYTYDVYDRMISVEGENSAVTYAYNTSGNLTGVTNGNGETTSYAYDKAGNITVTTDPLGNRSVSTYDESGRLIEYSSENGTATKYDYDALDRLVKKESGDSLSDASYSYDAMGRLISMDDVTGKSQYTYDTAGRLLSAVNGNGEKINYHYDIYGNVTEVVYPDGRKVSYTYDACDRMVSVTTLEGKTTEYTYDADGNLTRAVREDGETRIAYDKLGQVKGLVNCHEGKIISAYGYIHDGRGNIIKEEARLYLEEETVEQEYDYEYDGMSQLIRAVLSQTTTTAEGKKEQEKVTTSYVYDPAGNRLKMSTDRNGSLSTVTYTYDEAGRLVKSEDSEQGETVYTYDGAGNLIQEENTGLEGGIKYYQYDAADRLTAVMDRDNLLLAALYDGNGNRVFTMEYAPELIKNEAVRVPAGQEEEEGRKSSETAALTESDAYKDKKDEKGEDSEGTEGTASGAGASGSDSPGPKAFWYGVLCQVADIFLPAPTPFKAWLHNKMGFTDSVSVLFEKEVYEADLSVGSYSIQEEGSPFALVNNAVKATTGKELSSEAYRQVSYVNDISFSNEQVLIERAVNGSMGESVTGYSYGLWRESYSVEAGTGASVGLGTGSGTYYYTGTGSVANLVSGSGTRGYSYGPGGTVTVYGQVSLESQTNTQAAFYGYNGEYTHGSLGLQYLRARYLKMETGTFTSRDTYAGRVRDILSQNRYTYAENNPVTFADPSGHKAIGTILGNAFGNATGNGRTLSTGRSSSGGIGGIIGNAVQKITSPVNKVQNTSQNTYNRATGNRGAIVTAITNNIIAKAKGGITSILGGGSPSENVSGGIISFVKSVADQVEAMRCQAYERCKNIVQEVINDIGWRFAPTYAVPGTMYDPLPMEQQIANAEYIYNYLRAQGWSLEAICGVLGNMHIECHYNPGTWQYMDDADYGFGIVQWSDAESKFLNYLNDTQFGGKYKVFELIEVVDEMARNSPKELMDLELTYFLQSCEEDQWGPTTEYNCPAKVSFEEYVENEGKYNAREMALIFHGSYEKSNEEDSYEKRENWAEGWYDHFTGVKDIRECYKEYKY